MDDKTQKSSCNIFCVESIQYKLQWNNFLEKNTAEDVFILWCFPCFLLNSSVVSMYGSSKAHTEQLSCWRWRKITRPPRLLATDEKAINLETNGHYYVKKPWTLAVSTMKGQFSNQLMSFYYDYGVRCAMQMHTYTIILDTKLKDIRYSHTACEKKCDSVQIQRNQISYTNRIFSSKKAPPPFKNTRLLN